MVILINFNFKKFFSVTYFYIISTRETCINVQSYFGLDGVVTMNYLYKI